MNFFQVWAHSAPFKKGLRKRGENSFLDSIYNDKIKQSTAEKRKIYFSLPYMGYISDKIKCEIHELVNKRFPHLDLILVFRNNFTIGSFCKHKESLPAPLCSSVIYIYNCGECNSSYIGSTKRQFRCRIAEHMGVSVRTGRPLQAPNHSAIMEHHCITKHNISTNNFKILSKCNNNLYDLRTIESLYITKIKPNLNSGLPIELDIYI